jgi:hypothetical protein
VTYEAPAVEQRAEVGGPLIGVPSASPGASPAWRRSSDEPQEESP